MCTPPVWTTTSLPDPPNPPVRHVLNVRTRQRTVTILPVWGKGADTAIDTPPNPEARLLFSTASMLYQFGCGLWPLV